MLGTEEHNKEYFILDRLFRIFRKKNEREREKKSIIGENFLRKLRYSCDFFQKI